MSSPRLAIVSAGLAIFLIALPATTARRPRYGGALRVEIGAAVTSLDPTVAVANADEDDAKWEIDSLIYDVREADTTFRGAGPFHVTAFEAGKRVVLVATEDYRLGRPFVDAIEITMGRSARERILDLELNKTDFAEIPAEEARRAAERGVRVSRSRPDELLAVVFSGGDGGGGGAERAASERGKPVGAKMREAVALSIDRAAIVNFILQKEGEPAGGLLPQWSSGTAFLLSTSADPVHAKELSAQIVPAPKIVLGYDSGDSLEQAVAERIAVNAREAGIQVTAVAGRPGAENRADARIVRLRMQSRRPADALDSLLDELGAMVKIDAPALPGRATAEDIYNRERAIVGSYRLVPLVWLPHVYGLSARVRDWVAPGPGESWPLADVWLDGPVDGTAEREGNK
jgi:hypothetical protein